MYTTISCYFVNPMNYIQMISAEVAETELYPVKSIVLAYLPILTIFNGKIVQTTRENASELVRSPIRYGSESKCESGGIRKHYPYPPQGISSTAFALPNYILVSGIDHKKRDYNVQKHNIMSFSQIVDQGDDEIMYTYCSDVGSYIIVRTMVGAVKIIIIDSAGGRSQIDDIPQVAKWYFKTVRMLNRHALIVSYSSRTASAKCVNVLNVMMVTGLAGGEIHYKTVNIWQLLRRPECKQYGQIVSVASDGVCLWFATITKATYGERRCTVIKYDPFTEIISPTPFEVGLPKFTYRVEVEIHVNDWCVTVDTSDGCKIFPINHELSPIDILGMPRSLFNFKNGIIIVMDDSTNVHYYTGFGDIGVKPLENCDYALDTFHPIEHDSTDIVWCNRHTMVCYVWDAFNFELKQTINLSFQFTRIFKLVCQPEGGICIIGEYHNNKCILFI
jgi:hypothetical protein